MGSKSPNFNCLVINSLIIIMIKTLQNIFSDVSLSEIDSLKDIENSQIYRDFLSSYPNLSEIFESGAIRDEQEFTRTVKHIFRSIKIFLKLLNNSFSYEGFSENTIYKNDKIIMIQF